MVTLEELAARKNIAVDVLLRFGVSQRDFGLEFSYWDAAGGVGKARHRRALRGAGGSFWAEDDPHQKCEYANALRVLGMRGQAWVVEGESDCWVLSTYGQLGLGVPGAADVHAVQGRRLNIFQRLLIVRENPTETSALTYPEGESAFSDSLAVQLRSSGYRGDLVVCSPPRDCQDLSEMHTADTGRFLDNLHLMESNARHI